MINSFYLQGAIDADVQMPKLRLKTDGEVQLKVVTPTVGPSQVRKFLQVTSLATAI